MALPFIAQVGFSEYGYGSQKSATSNGQMNMATKVFTLVIYEVWTAWGTGDPYGGQITTSLVIVAYHKPTRTLVQDCHLSKRTFVQDCPYQCVYKLLAFFHYQPIWRCLQVCSLVFFSYQPHICDALTVRWSPLHGGTGSTSTVGCPALEIASSAQVLAAASLWINTTVVEILWVVQPIRIIRISNRLIMV